jgi:A/G-specific adenine glycosylase
MPQYTQALMDFGATVCKPTSAKCQSETPLPCIYLKDCWAYQHDQVREIPLKIKKTITKLVVSEMLLLIDQDELLLTKRDNSGIWGGLWALPETPWLEVEDINQISTLQFQANQYLHVLEFTKSENYHSHQSLAARKHVFSHRTLYFFVKIIRLNKNKIIYSPSCQWTKISDLPSLGLPTPIKKLLEDYEFLARG